MISEKKIRETNWSEIWQDLRRASAFMVRELYLTKRYMSWVIVFAFYAVVNSSTIVLIGVAAENEMQTLNLLLGVLLWSYLSVLFHEIANSISYERWEGTIEYTFMAPVSRFTHLVGLSTYAAVFAFVQLIIIGGALVLFVDVDLTGANLIGVAVILMLASISFIGLGLITAILPLLSTENGAQAANIVQGLLLLVSGVYFPVEVLPGWLQPLSAISPATYALNAGRQMLGINVPGSVAGDLAGQPLGTVLPELGILVVFGILSIPIGLTIFNRAERWAKMTGRLKRSG